MHHEIPHSTHDNPLQYWTPPWYSWYPPRYWTPPQYSWYPPTCIMISPTVLNTPTVLKISPTVLMISPTVLNTPRYWNPHGTAHTLYRVILNYVRFLLSIKTKTKKTSDRWDLSLSSEEQLLAWLPMWCWTHSMANWLKYSCGGRWVFQNMVQRIIPYLIRFCKGYELLFTLVQSVIHLLLTSPVPIWMLYLANNCLS